MYDVGKESSFWVFSFRYKESTQNLYPSFLKEAQEVEALEHQREMKRFILQASGIFRVQSLRMMFLKLPHDQ